MFVECENDHVVVVSFLSPEEQKKVQENLRNSDGGNGYIPLRVRIFHDRIEMDVFDGNGKVEQKLLDYVDFLVMNDAINTIFQKRDMDELSAPINIKIDNGDVKVEPIVIDEDEELEKSPHNRAMMLKTEHINALKDDKKLHVKIGDILIKIEKVDR